MPANVWWGLPGESASWGWRTAAALLHQGLAKTKRFRIKVVSVTLGDLPRATSVSYTRLRIGLSGALR